MPVPVILLALGMASGPAQTPSSTPDAKATTATGVYTAAQADAGKALYASKCSMCHGAKLEGGGQNPPLAGQSFLGQWKGQSLDDLYTMIQATMPATNPGSLTPDQTVQLMAYILKANAMPEGKTNLSKDEADLKTIQIAKP